MPGPNFVLVTELQTLTRRDFTVASGALLNPFNANPLVDGEFLAIDANYQLARGSGEGTDPNVFPVHTERGRYDTQAIGKANVLMLGMYEAETEIYDSTGLVLGGALTVQDVTIGGLVKRGLKLEGVTAGRVRVGFVTKLMTGKVRFVHFANQKM
jgi:hypothetical protein